MLQEIVSQLKKAVMPLVSVLIAGVLLFQAAATFRVLCPPAQLARLGLREIACEPWTWPFVNYPMYSQAHYAGAALNHYYLFGLLSDSGEIAIAPADLGITVFQFQHLVERLLDDDSVQARAFAQEYARRHGQPLRGLRLENRPMILLQDGWQEGEAETVQSIVWEGESQ